MQTTTFYGEIVGDRARDELDIRSAINQVLDDMQRSIFRVLVTRDKICYDDPVLPLFRR